MQGHIIAIAPVSEEIKRISGWLVEWVKAQDLDLEPTLYTCSSLKLARKSLQLPLDLGNPPFLILIDHSLPENNISEFADEIRAGVPESWVIELVHEEYVIPRDEKAFILKHPVDREEWNEVMEHLFKHAATPQWSRAISN